MNAKQYVIELVVLLVLAISLSSGCVGNAILAKGREKGGRCGIKTSLVPDLTATAAKADFPVVVRGRTFGGVATTFRIEEWHPKSTQMNGSIELSNTVHTPLIFTVCVDGGGISYHITLLDKAGDCVGSLPGRYYNWAPRRIYLAPNETKRIDFDIVLRDYFDLPIGIYSLVFTYNELMLPAPYTGRKTTVAWLTKPILLQCE